MNGVYVDVVSGILLRRLREVLTSANSRVTCSRSKPLTNPKHVIEHVILYSPLHCAVLTCCIIQPQLICFFFCLYRFGFDIFRNDDA